MSSPERSPASGPPARRSTFTPALAYSVLTPVYDTALEALGLGRSFKAAVAELAEVKPGEIVLDLGCGTGTLLQALVAHQPDARFTGIDPDPQVLAIARRRLQHSTPPVELVEGYAQDLPFPDEAFQLVISTTLAHPRPMPPGSCSPSAPLRRPGRHAGQPRRRTAGHAGRRRLRRR